MNEKEKIIEVIDKLLQISNCYMECYCETYDEWVQSDDDIKRIEDEEDRDKAIELKENSDYLYYAAEFLENFKERALVECEELEE